MIVSIRVDDRLIHGQVALVWSKEFGITRIVVANDEAVNNEMQKMTLQMATPAGIKLLIKSVNDAITVFNSEKAKDVDMFVLTNTIQDALKIAENCPDIKSINIANVGRFDKSENKISINSCLLLNEQELDALEEFKGYPYPVYHQVIPSSPKVSVEKLLAQAKSQKK